MMMAVMVMRGKLNRNGIPGNSLEFQEFPGILESSGIQFQSTGIQKNPSTLNGLLG
jgi:hypothetical protein